MTGLRRYKNRRDVFMAVLAPGTEVAGVFTTSKCPGAPVEWCREALKGGTARALVVNSGNANAFTGLKGGLAVKRGLLVAGDAGQWRAAVAGQGIVEQLPEAAD